MGLRLYSEFKSSADKEYKIEIYDSEWSLPSSSFNVAGNGFELNYSSETDNIVSPIIGSKCTIKAYNNTDVFDTFINDLTQYQEKRFTVKIIVQDLKVLSDFEKRVINDGGTFEAESCLRSDLIDLGASLEPVTYWTGIITQDLATEEDVSKPRIFEITATDGIGHLANKEYETISNVTIESFIESAVGAIGLDELYSATDPLYATTVNVWDTNHTYSATTDVSTLIRFDSRVYTNTEEDGTVVYSTYLDILRELCTAFGARFYQKDGIFHFEQYLERAESTRTVSTYQFNGTLADTSTVDDDITLDQTSAGGARMAGNMFNYLPALKKVQVAFDQNRTSNLLGNNIIFTGATGRKNLGFVPDDNNGRLQIDLALSYQLTLNSSPPTIAQEFYRPVWKIEVRTEDVNNPGTFYYLKRDWTPGTIGAQLYGATSWATTPSYYYVDAGIAKNETSLFLSGPASLITPPLPVDGTVEIDIDFDKAYDINNAAQTPPAYFDETITSVAKKVVFINDTGNLNQVEVFSATNDDANINSNLILDLGKLRVSDAAGLQGSFYVYDGSGWVRSTQWRRGNTGSFASLFKLLTKEILSLHKKPIERYNGTIIGAFPFGTRYEFDSAFWIPLNGDYDANMDEWRCEWFAIDKIESNITTADPVGEGGAPDFTGRLSGQQGTDEVINAVDINTTTSAVTGNATVGGTLGVTGDISGSDISASNDITATGNVSGTDVNASNDITATGNVSGTDLNASNDITASGNLSVTDVTASGDLSVSNINASNDITASGNVSATDVGATNVNASNNITATGNVSGTDISASNNITASNQLTAANASLDNFVTKTAIIGSTALVDSFKTRVENDGGTFEAFDSLLDTITPLLIGTAEKSAVIYGDTSVETLDASKSITASGNVSATNLNASNNATITGTLSVSGASLLQSTGVTNFTHTGNQIENIRDIEHEPGDVYSINDSDFMIFNTWSPGAANGSSTINLPAAADYEGRLLRFKSDGTISSNHEIKLVPDGGDTIDGSAEFSFSRDYDGVMIMAHNGEWFIVQRKSK